MINRSVKLLGNSLTLSRAIPIDYKSNRYPPTIAPLRKKRTFELILVQHLRYYCISCTGLVAPLSIDKQKAAKRQALPDHVVAIGASAGGLEAIQELARQLVLPGHFAYIVAQHLAPDHPSLLVDLVARKFDEDS